MADIAVGLTRITRQVVEVEVKGTAPLIVHAWSKKAKEMMLAAQQGKKTPKRVKDPERDFHESRYIFADGSGDGVPIMAFKAATIKGGGRAFGKAVKMTELRQNLTFLPDGDAEDGTQLARIVGGPPTMREDMVRVGMGMADIRYRAVYAGWSVVLRVQFVPALIDVGSVVALIDAGGTCGVGEFRPEKNGSFGTYEVTA